MLMDKKILEFNVEEIKAFMNGLRPKPGKRSGYNVLWQALVCSWQFKDLQKSIAYYERFKDKAYLAEASTHLADLLMQVICMIIILNIDPEEIMEMGLNRLREHAKIEIYPKLWE